MDAKFWQNRWLDNVIPFHRLDVNHYLEKYVDGIALGDGGEVLVPLCGKSVDMRWLAGRGCRVTGVELSEIAVRDFFTEQAITAQQRQDGAFRVLARRARADAARGARISSDGAVTNRVAPRAAATSEIFPSARDVPSGGR